MVAAAATIAPIVRITKNAVDKVSLLYLADSIAKSD